MFFDYFGRRIDDNGYGYDVGGASIDHPTLDVCVACMIFGLTTEQIIVIAFSLPTV